MVWGNIQSIWETEWVWSWRSEMCHRRKRSEGVSPYSIMVSNIFLYTSHEKYLPADAAPLAYFCIISLRSDLELHCYPVWHNCVYIESGILFHWLFLKLVTMLMVIQPIVALALHEYTSSMGIQVHTNLITRSFAIINFLYGYLNILIYDLILLLLRLLCAPPLQIPLLRFVLSWDATWEFDRQSLSRVEIWTRRV